MQFQNETNRKREYGGYLPFENFVSNDNRHYFDKYEQNVTMLNCGRSCFYVAARSIEIKKIYVPYFTCVETAQPFKDLGISVEFYRLDSDLLPKDVNLKTGEYILWTNYYGNASEEIISLIENKYEGQLIVDNCHTFYCRPLKKALNCYSARKFIGVSDGAYLVSDLVSNFNINDLERDNSYPFMQHLFKQGEDGTNEGYALNLENEKRLEKNYGLISITSEKILSSVDYKKIKDIRKNNLSVIHSYLGDLNDFPVNIDVALQMYYPFKCKDRQLRDKLINKKIYNPTWWRHVIDELGEESVESEYALETVLLPVDQRYGEDDMKILGDTTKNLIEI